MRTNEINMTQATKVQLKRVNGNKNKIPNSSTVQVFSSKLTVNDSHLEVVKSQVEVFFNELTTLVRIDNIYRGFL